MRYPYAALASGLLLAVSTAHADPALRLCTAADVATGKVSTDSKLPAYRVTAAHRQFEIAPITYRQTPLKRFGYVVSVLVGTDGAPVCFSPKHAVFGEDTVTPERQAYASVVANWRYTPFQVDGKAVSVFVDEGIREEVLPARHVAMPSAPPSTEIVSLTHGPCLGKCPAYTVTLAGDGRATYEGRDYVDVTGTFSYTVPEGDAAALIDRLRARDLWSMDDSYAAPITDANADEIDVAIGVARKTIVDYLGPMAGMPVAVSLSEADIDKVAHSRDMAVLSMQGVKILQDAGFDFASQAGAELLYRVVSSPIPHDEKAIMALVDLGAPTTTGRAQVIAIPLPGQDPKTVVQPWASQPLLDAAIAHGYPALVARLEDARKRETGQ